MGPVDTLEKPVVEAERSELDHAEVDHPEAVAAGAEHAAAETEHTEAAHTAGTGQRPGFIARVNEKLLDPSWGDRPTIFWATIAAAALAIIGGFGPWATIFGALTVSGTSGDGWLVIVPAVAGIGLVFTHYGKPAAWKGIGLIVVALVASVVSVLDLIDIHNVASGSSGLVQPAWGLYVAALGSLVMLGAALFTLVKKPYKN